ncbi:hypothetical protein [Acidomonas methanolica]|nr:hypothetical protein [Acidomonas methanolica]TCS23790.1 hypothetical protein EDC31_1278 [Acidomonas methanolica]
MFWTSALCSPPVLATPVPEFPEMYRTTDGSLQRVRIVTPLNGQHSPFITQYRDNTGQWRPAIVVQDSCGLDVTGAPVACDYLRQSQVNAPSGVAGLDANGIVTEPVMSQTILANRVYTAPDGTSVTLPTVSLAGTAAYSTFFTLGAESVAFGGQTDAAGTVGNTALTIVGRPYGNYNAGCTLCVFSTASSLGGGAAQAALSGIDYRTGAPAIANGDAAAAGFYQYDEVSDARIVAQASAFTATTVTLSTPMTDEQMATLHPGMYVATNVIDPSVATTDSYGVPSENAYWGYIQSWTPTTLTVYGWAVLGAGNAAAGQIPDVTHLDTTKSTYTMPMVFVGAPGKIWSKNTYVVMDGNKIYGANATARANNYEREELDFRAANFTNANSLTYHGWTTSFQCIPCASGAASADSYAYLVNGPGLPKAYVAQLYGSGLEYSGYSTWLPSNGSPSAQGGNHIMFDFASALSTGNTLHFGAKVYKDLADSSNWANWDVRLGLNVDGTRAQDVFSGGSDMAQLAWNYEGAGGTLCVLTPGYMGADPNACFNDDGSTTIYGSLTSKGAATFDAPLANVWETSAAALSAETSSGTASGQGTLSLWNTVKAGGASSEYVNVDPGTSGGFSWYELTTGAALDAGTQLAFLNGDGLTVSGNIVAGKGKSVELQDSNGSVGYTYLNTNGWVTTASSSGGFIGYSAPAFRETLTTPSSSSAPCTAGQFTDDSNYHYVCVAANTWKRVALSSF